MFSDFQIRKAIYLMSGNFLTYQIDYIICSQRWRSSIQSAKIRPGADCGSDHELLIAKFTKTEESRENH